MVDRVAREPLGQACRRELARMWPARPVVCRVRRLHVRVEMSPRELNETSLTSAWAAAFCRAVLSAINRPPGWDEAIVADSRAEWIATFLLDVLNGTAPGKWAYEEFGRYVNAPPGETVLSLLQDEASEIPATMAAVVRRDGLDGMLAALGATGCDRLSELIDSQVMVQSARLSIADLIGVGRLALEDGRSKGRWRPLATSARAIAIYAARLIAREGAVDGVDSPGRILALLRTIERLLPLGRLAGVPQTVHALELGPAGLRPEESLDSVQRELLGAIRALGSSGAGVPGALTASEAGTSHALVRELDEVLDGLRSAIPGRGGETTPTATSRWVMSRCAGLFFLVALVRRLGWPEAVRQSLLGAQHGSRALTYVLAGVALAILGRSSTDTGRFDPGAALFAGWTEEPQMAGFVRCLEMASTDIRHDLLRRLAPGMDLERFAESWDGTFDHLAARLVSAFGERLRGFRKASQRFVVERFLAVAGRIGVEPARLRVELESNPLWVVIHVSSLDEPVDAVSWLDGRRVELLLEGL